MAGRLGYCALDRTRAVLQGDEIRACWQAPSRPEPYEGLFTGLDATDGAVDPVAGPADGVSRERDRVETRTWAIPVLPDASPHLAASSAGLREATYVPARSMVRSAATDGGRAASDDLELRHVAEGLAVGQRDEDGHDPIADDGVLGDPDP